MINDLLNVKETITIQQPPEKVYQFWRRLENLPIFMSHLEDVKQLNNRLSHWKAKAPMGSSVEWDAYIKDEKENKLISWASKEGADVENAGTVWFTELASSGDSPSATLLEVELSYRPPFGKLGAAVAKLFGENPSQQIEEDLKKLKKVLESDLTSNQQNNKTQKSEVFDNDQLNEEVREYDDLF